MNIRGGRAAITTFLARLTPSGFHTPTQNNLLLYLIKMFAEFIFHPFVEFPTQGKTKIVWNMKWFFIELLSSDWLQYFLQNVNQNFIFHLNEKLSSAMVHRDSNDTMNIRSA